MNEVLEAIYKAALEEVVVLLNNRDPLVRLEAALGIIGALSATEEEEYYEGEDQPDRDDMAEVDEFPGPDSGTTLVPATGEVLDAIQAERDLAAQQALEAQEERVPPAAERAGRSALGSGEMRR